MCMETHGMFVINFKSAREMFAKKTEQVRRWDGMLCRHLRRHVESADVLWFLKIFLTNERHSSVEQGRALLKAMGRWGLLRA